MSRGILFYAHNNRHIDYGKIALANSCLIKKHMKNNSVTMVTDEGTVNWLYKAYSKEFVDSKIDNIKVERRRNTPKARMRKLNKDGSRVNPRFPNKRNKPTNKGGY